MASPAQQRSVAAAAPATEIGICGTFGRSLEASGLELGSLASVSLLLGTGGDQRIWPDPVSGRNRYGTLTRPAHGEISFSSSTASNVSSEGFAAADHALRSLIEGDARRRISVEGLFDDIRNGVRRELGCVGAEIVLAASGTDAELVALCILAGLSKRPLTNVFVAPDETGNGVPRAAAGCHFSELTALGRAVEAGAPVAGVSRGRIEVRTIALRGEAGERRREEDIDDDLISVVEHEIRRDRDVIVHVLDTSKTGLTGVTREAARHVAALAPGRVRIIIDACQMRCPISQLRSDLADGFIVTTTASKFIAAPPFAGAILFPTSLIEEISSSVEIPVGLVDYTAAEDWSPVLRARMSLPLKSEMNLGLGLRWVAGLTNLVRYTAVDASDEALIKAAFARLVRARAEVADGICLHDDDDGEHIAARVIAPLTVLKADGSYASFGEAHQIQLAMRHPNSGPICHVGQAVRVGPRAVLRVCASVSDIAAVAERLTAGQSMEKALGPLESDLDVFFNMWSSAHHRISAV